jgi:hypothetical protein
MARCERQTSSPLRRDSIPCGTRFTKSAQEPLNALLNVASQAEQISTAGSETQMYMPRSTSSSEHIKPLPGDEPTGRGLKS